jgi:hypothetical protein
MSYVLCDMPVYQRGGASIRESIFRRERTLSEGKWGVKAPGKGTYKLSTKKGECNTVLSTYYIKQRHTALYQKIISRLGAIEEIGFLQDVSSHPKAKLTGSANEKPVSNNRVALGIVA